MAHKIRFMETILRDGQQSQIATRMPIEDMVPILETLDACGFESLEVWGGATFDSCLRFLNEDPWERLRTIRSHVKNTKLQMLLRGQNLLGYRNYADDVVEALVKKSVENGIDVLRIFDALNDTRNLTTSIRAAKEAGGEVQAAICYTTSEVHTIRYFVTLANEMERAGADSICIKDMAGVLTPDVAFELVSEIKALPPAAGGAHARYGGHRPDDLLKAVEAGADIIDTCMSPLRKVQASPRPSPWPSRLRAWAMTQASTLAPWRRSPRRCCPCATASWIRRPQPQGAGRRPQGAALQGSRRHALQPAQPAEGDAYRGSLRRGFGGGPARSRRYGIPSARHPALADGWHRRR